MNLIIHFLLAFIGPYLPALALVGVAVLLIVNALERVAIWFVGAAVVAALLGGAWQWHRHEVGAADAAGYARADAYWKGELEKAAKARQDREAEAVAGMQEDIAALRTKNDDLEAQLKASDDEADKDPNGALCGLRLDGVRRVNAVH